MPSYLLSILARNYPPMLRASFMSEFCGPWLVWEPGAWAPAPRSQLTQKTVPADVRPGARRASATIALAMHLQLAEGRSQLNLGRDPTCELYINDVTLSRVHLHLTRTGEEWLVLDPGSLNGTQVNGIPLPHHTPTPLRDQMELDAGDVLLTVQSSAALFKRLHAPG